MIARKGGWLSIDPSTTANNEQYIGEGDDAGSPWIISSTAAEKSDLWFEGEIRLPVIDEEVGIFFGLAGVLLGPFVGAVVAELSAGRDVQQGG